jgi:hypothetical protein
LRKTIALLGCLLSIFSSIVIRKSNENPYLRGKPPKKYINVEFSEMQNPFAGMNELERAAAIRSFAKSHADNFTSSLARLNELCRRYNFFQLLAHFAYYDQLLLDSEKEGATYSPVEQNAAELLQALVLTIPEQELQLRLDDPPPPEVLLEINKLLGGITTSFSLKRFGSSTSGKKSPELLSEMMRTHTATVRNEGFASQVRRTMTEIVAPLDRDFEGKRGLKLTNLATMLWNVATAIESRINEDLRQRHAVLGRKTSTEILEAFLKHHASDEERAARFRREIQDANLSVRNLRHYLTTLWDDGNFKLFKFSLNDLISAYPDQVEPSIIKQLVTQWSVPIGGLADQDVEHFFLDNPVWSRPIIQFGPDHFLLPIPGLVQSFGRQLLERVLQTEPELWDKYLSKVRPKYLEHFVRKLFVAAVPVARVIAGVRWVDPENSRRYETDLLVIHDAHALIVESKAGRISGRARRGDPARLEKEIGKLIGEPTLQSQRFAALLSSAKGPLQLQSSDGATHSVDATKLLRISRINVTLDYFGPVGLLARMLRESGVVSADLKPAATLSMHELESVVEILDRPAFLFHYLDRRAEIEASNDLLANEIGVLSLYLATGFDLGEFEGGTTKPLALPAMDRDLEPYFMGKELRRPVSKPKRKLTAWWNDMLITVEKRATFGWMESSYALLSVAHERQKLFERGVKKMLNEVKSKWRDPAHQNVCYLFAGSPARRITVMCVGVKNTTLEQQRETVRKAFNAAYHKEATSSAVAIVKSANTKTYPYSAIYYIRPEDD